MNHIEGVDRNQLTLMPDAIEDYVSEDHPVRFVDAFVDHLDLADLRFQKVETAETGRPPYHPGDMLRLNLYAYLNRIRSSRALEREAHRNLELLWLIKRLAPDFKTIADFRRNNRQAIQQVCREFTRFCLHSGLFGGELIAVDGSKFRASNARDRNYSRNKVKNNLMETDRKIQHYLEQLDKNDRNEAGVRDKSAKELKAIIAHLKKRKKELGVLDRRMDKTGQKQVSLTDLDCRSMPAGKSQGTKVGCNVQTSVDDKDKLILDHEVTNDVTDQGHLCEMGIRAKKILGVKKFDLLADMGYYDGQEVAECMKAGIHPWISKPNTSVNRKKGLFTKDDFRYSKRRDCDICPAGKRLEFRFQTHELGRDVRYYATTACGGCR
jgi:transposase